jgi:glycosyltransferase involved in cell wall biosynthesis
VLSIIVPVYNERGTLKQVVERLRALSIEKEVVVVDDGSDDGSREAITALSGLPGVRVARIEHGGKGAAVRRGFAEARGELVIVHDADLELDAEEVVRVSAPVREGRAELAFGSRFLHSAAKPLSPRYWANRLLTGLFNLLYGTRLTDVACCYKCCRKDLVLSLGLASSGFEIDCELAAKIVKKGLRPVEVPVYYQPRTRAQGKKISWLDGVTAALALIKNRV